MLVLAGLLVVGQAIAFVVLRSQKKAEPAAANNVVATTAVDAAEPIVTPDASVASVEVVAPPDAAAITEEPPDAALVVETKEPKETKDPKDEKKAKKPTRAELAAQAKKEREEKRREEQERAAQLERERERERERRRLEQERVAAEKIRLEAEAERQRLAKEKAELEAAKAAAEKARLEALAKQKTAEPKVDVLVLVLGPGTPSMSSEQIRNVYLGRASVWPNGTTARPINRPAGSAAGRKFYGGILKMSSGAFVEHWSELQLSGGGIAPGVVSSGKSVVARVAATQGGFGYVMESELPPETSGVRLVRLK